MFIADPNIAKLVHFQVRQWGDDEVDCIVDLFGSTESQTLTERDLPEDNPTFIMDQTNTDTCLCLQIRSNY